MNDFASKSWQDYYRAALLETDPAKLPPLVEAAIHAIQQNLAQMEKRETPADLRTLEDALQNLRVLQREYS